MRKLIIALTLTQLFCIGLAYSADKAPTVIKRADLPTTLKGGKATKNADGIPSCTVGRAKVAGDTMEDWASTHQNHACANAATMLVCRAGKNLSVRCE